MNAPKIQLCTDCDDPTGRCEDDSLYVAEDHPVCEDCYRRYPQCDCCGARYTVENLKWIRLEAGVAIQACESCSR